MILQVLRTEEQWDCEKIAKVIDKWKNQWTWITDVSVFLWKIWIANAFFCDLDLHTFSSSDDVASTLDEKGLKYTDVEKAFRSTQDFLKLQPSWVPGLEYEPSELLRNDYSLAIASIDSWLIAGGVPMGTIDHDIVIAGGKRPNIFDPRLLGNPCGGMRAISWDRLSNAMFSSPWYMLTIINP